MSANTVRWYAPDDAGETEDLERWCVTVGPAVLDSLPSRVFERAAGAGPLTAVSWNAAVGSGDVLKFLNHELDLRCVDGTPQLGARFSHFVLLLQEAHRLAEEVPPTAPHAPLPKTIDPVERPGPILDITEVAAGCGLALIYIPSARNGDREQGDRREDKGNAILASLPLSDFLAIEMPLEASRKVLVGATLTLPDGGRLRAISVHLDVSASLSRTLISGNSWRLEQAEALIESIGLADHASGSPAGELSVATLIAGDFNVWSANNSALQRLRREYPTSPPKTGIATRGAFAPDHLFFGRAADGWVRLVPDSFRVIDQLYYSDHKALAVQVTTGR